MNFIEDREQTIVGVEPLMVEIMKARVLIVPHPWPLVPAMVRLCAKDGKHNPYIDCHNVRSHEQHASEERHNIAQKELNRMRISCHEAYGCCELMMLLVNVAVCPSCMQPSVRVVKENLVDKHVTENVVRNLHGLWHCGIEAQCILAQQFLIIDLSLTTMQKTGMRNAKVEGDLPCNLGEETPVPADMFLAAT